MASFSPALAPCLGPGGRESAGGGLAIVKFRFLLLLLILGFFPHHRFVHVISIA
jgi:hypothetical protein